MDESIRQVPSLDGLRRHSSTPTAREWRLHGALFLLTIASTIIAGTLLAAPEPLIKEPPLATPLDYLLYLPLSYLYGVSAYLELALHNPALIVNGATFSASLIAILFSN